MKKIISFIQKEYILTIAFILFVVFSIIYGFKIEDFMKFIDWQTITSLSALLIIVTALKESGFLQILAKSSLNHLLTERILALTLIGFSIILSSFLSIFIR